VRVDARTQQFIEKMGLLSEADGLPRIAGRIFGYLMITPGECSLDQIAEALGVSRASVSTDARRLAQHGLLERRGRPGDRRDYYAISPEGFRNLVETRIQAMKRFHELLEEGRRLPHTSAEVTARLQEWDQGHEEVLGAFRRVLERLDTADATGG
jgi:DNA-binding transcriptional regulator GbsR (MarR family)